MLITHNKLVHCVCTAGKKVVFSASIFDYSKIAFFANNFLYKLLQKINFLKK